MNTSYHVENFEMSEVELAEAVDKCLDELVFVRDRADLMRKDADLLTVDLRSSYFSTDLFYADVKIVTKYVAKYLKWFHENFSICSNDNIKER